MIRRLFIFLFILINSAALAQLEFSGHSLIRNFSPEEIRGGIQSWNIVQDSREVIYVANNFGLLQYDGSNWSLFPVRNGTKVRSVHVGSGNRIYVGSQADFGFFKPNHSGTLEYTSLADSLPENIRNFDEVWRIYGVNDEIFFMTFRYIYRYQVGSPLQAIRAGSPLEFSFLVNNNIYSLIWNRGLAVLESDSLRLLAGGEFFAQRQIASIIPLDKTGLLIFTISDGIFSLTNGKITPFSPNTEHALSGVTINHVVLLHDGNFAVGTQNNGLMIVSRTGKLINHISRATGLNDQTVHTVYEDVNHNLWLGLNNGLAMVEISSPFTVVDVTKGITGTGYAALQHGQHVYLGTNNGLFLWKPLTNGNNFTQVKNSLGQVYRLTRIGDLLLMGHHNGPYLIQNDEAKLIADEKGVWEFVSVPSRPDHVIMGSYNGLSLLHVKDNSITFRHKFKDFVESSRVLEFTNNNELWMAHGYKGLFKIRFDPSFETITETKFYNTQAGFPSSQLINMERVRGELVFPALFGVYQYSSTQDNFQISKDFSDLFQPDEHIVVMEEDVLGNIYFISNQRVGRIEYDRFGKALINDQLFNKIRDLLNDDLSVIQIIDSRNVLFGAKNGFVHFNASKNKILQPFFTHITRLNTTAGERDSVLLEGHGVAARGSLTLPYQLNAVRFTYAAAFYENNDKTQYQFLLENFDAGWSEWSYKTEKEYTNLHEGTYHFQVRARNIYGTISEARRFTLIINPPFYRSKVAYAIYTFSFLVVAGFVFMQIDRRFKKEKKMILLKQQRELLKKDSQIQHITTQSEQEIIRLKNEKLQVEVDHVHRELTSSTIHLINKNEVLNNVRISLEEYLRKYDHSDKDALKKVIRTIDQNISSDGDWKQFELHFNNAHGNFTNRLLEAFPRLTPQEVKLCAYLRLNLTTKEIAHLLSISVRGVEISRYRLRKKLNLGRNDNLTEFILKF